MFVSKGLLSIVKGVWGARKVAQSAHKVAESVALPALTPFGEMLRERWDAGSTPMSWRIV